MVIDLYDGCGRNLKVVFPQLDYSEDNFFENVLENLAGRTKKEMSMLGQVKIFN